MRGKTDTLLFNAVDINSPPAPSRCVNHPSIYSIAVAFLGPECNKYTLH